MVFIRFGRSTFNHTRCALTWNGGLFRPSITPAQAEPLADRRNPSKANCDQTRPQIRSPHPIHKKALRLAHPSVREIGRRRALHPISPFNLAKAVRFLPQMLHNRVEDELRRKEQDRHRRTAGSRRIHGGNICTQGTKRDIHLRMDRRQQFSGAHSCRGLRGTEDFVKRNGLMRSRRIAVFLDQKNKQQVRLDRAHAVVEKVHQLLPPGSEDFVDIGRHFKRRDGASVGLLSSYLSEE